MKTKIFFYLIFSLSTICIKSQVINNAGFENWTWINMGTGFYSPQYWYANIGDNNEYVSPGIPYQGNYSMQLNDTGYSSSLNQFTDSLVCFHAFVKANIDGIDTVFIRTSINSGGTFIDTIKWFNSTTISDWTLISIPLSYYTALTCTLKIELIGGHNSNTVFWVDDIYLDTQTGIQNKNFAENVTCFYSSIPSNEFDLLKFDRVVNKKIFVNIYDSNGKLEFLKTDQGVQEMFIDKKNISKGIKIIKVLIDDRIITTENIIIL